MQTHDNSTASSASQEHEDIQLFILEGLFPPSHVFAFHRPLRTLMHLYQDEQVPHPLVQGEQQFSEREGDLLQPLLTYYPHYTPYEVLHASFFKGFARLSESVIANAQMRLEALRAEEGMWDAEMRPMRNVMSRVRLKLRRMGLDTVCMVEVGYLLINNPKW